MVRLRQLGNSRESRKLKDLKELKELQKSCEVNFPIKFIPSIKRIEKESYFFL